MDKLRTLCKRIFFLSPRMTVIIAVPSFVFVGIVLSMSDHSVAAYVAYALSAYALIICMTGLPRVVRAVRDGFYRLPIIQKINSTKIGSRLLGDTVFRSEISLHGGLAANLLYAAMYVVSGIMHPSAWIFTLAVYYVLLSVMRSTLVTYIHRHIDNRDAITEYRRYRLVGIGLLFMNQALAAMVVYMAYKGKGSTYPGLMIYAMALYTFYITISSLCSLAGSRRQNSPLYSAIRVLSFTASLVSMLSLETAMLTHFDTNGADFRRMMTGISGCVVCVLVMVMAVYMIVRATRTIKKLKTDGFSEAQSKA